MVQTLDHYAHPARDRFRRAARVSALVGASTSATRLRTRTVKRWAKEGSFQIYLEYRLRPGIGTQAALRRDFAKVAAGDRLWRSLGRGSAASRVRFGPFAAAHIACRAPERGSSAATLASGRAEAEPRSLLPRVCPPADRYSGTGPDDYKLFGGGKLAFQSQMTQ